MGGGGAGEHHPAGLPGHQGDHLAHPVVEEVQEVVEAVGVELQLVVEELVVGLQEGQLRLVYNVQKY